RSSIVLLLDRAALQFCTLSLHDALPISTGALSTYLTRLYTRGPLQDLKAAAKGAVSLLPSPVQQGARRAKEMLKGITIGGTLFRSEEHTSELQSRENLVCRLLLEKKK